MTEAQTREEDVWGAKTWRVRVAEGETEVGPVSLDQVRRGLEIGKLESSAQIARQDSDTWLSARQIVNAAVLRDKTLAAKPPEPQPPPEPVAEVSTVHVSDPDRTTPGARMPTAAGPALSWAKVVPLVLLSMFAVAAISFASFHYFGPRPNPAPAHAPFAVDRLPRWTIAVSEGRIREDLDDLATLPPAYLSSWLAEHACGGVDLARLLTEARGGDLARLHTLGVVDLAGQERWLAALRCGEEVARHLQGHRRRTITFEVDGQTQRVTHLTIDMDRMPHEAGRIPHTYAGLTGFCQDDEPGGEPHCSPDGPAGAREGENWFFGSHRAVDAFAGAYTSAHRERSSNLDILAELSRRTRKASSHTWLVRPRVVPWKSLCAWAAPDDASDAFVRACFPPTSRNVFESAETKIRGLAVERDDIAAENRIRWSLVFLARSEDAARWIEADLQDVRRDWRSHLMDTEPRVIKLLRDANASAHDQLRAAAVEPLLRAVGDVRVERRGPAVRLEIDTALTPHEQKTLQEVVQRPRPEHEAMSAVIEAAAKGNPVPVDPLSRFLDPDVAAWAAAPRASAETCQSLHAKFESLASDPSSLDLVDLRSRLDAAFSPASCNGRVLPESYRQCLLSAASLHAFAACEPPRSPYAVDAHRRLRGRWSIDSLDTRRAERWHHATGQAARTCRLEVGEHRVAYDCLGSRGTGPLRIEADGLGRATLYLPVGEELQPRRFVLGEESNEWVMEDFARGVRATFRRAAFASLLGG